METTFEKGTRLARRWVIRYPRANMYLDEARIKMVRQYHGEHVARAFVEYLTSFRNQEK